VSPIKQQSLAQATLLDIRPSDRSWPNLGDVYITICVLPIPQLRYVPHAETRPEWKRALADKYEYDALARLLEEACRR
jgi:hypothetical protein